MQSVSGVNLDEEAANLLQWQQAYQASAQALTVANGLFTTLDRFGQRHVSCQGARHARHAKHGANAVLDGAESARVQISRPPKTASRPAWRSRRRRKIRSAPGSWPATTRCLRRASSTPPTATSAQGSLNTEDNALTQVQNQLQSLRDLALEANNGTESPADLQRHRDPGARRSKESLLVDRQYPGRQRQLHLRRLRDANAALRVERHGRDLQRRSRAASGPDRRGPDRRHRRQRRSRVQSDQDRQRHLQRDAPPPAIPAPASSARPPSPTRPPTPAARYAIKFTAPTTYQVRQYRRRKPW